MANKLLQVPSLFALSATCLLSAGLLSGQPATFSTGASYTTPNGPVTVTTGDFNGDGVIDMAYGNIAAQSVSVQLGKGDGTFLPAVTLALNCEVTFVTTGDFNGDGKVDLLGNCISPSPILFVLPGRGDGTFGPPVTTSLPGQALAGFEEFTGEVAIADFNGDGKLDLVTVVAFGGTDVLSGNSGTYLLLGKGDGSFQSPVALSLGAEHGLLVADGDFNGDGKLDLVVSTARDTGMVTSAGNAIVAGSVLILFGDGKGGFQIGPDFQLGNQVALSIGVADLNGDGKLDVVIGELVQLGAAGTSTGASLSVLLGNGDGTLRQGYTVTDPGTAVPLVLLLADVRGSGHLDAVQSEVPSSPGGPGSVIVRPGNGDGTFGPRAAFALSGDLYPTALALADLNNDGRPDVTVAALSGSALSTVSDPSMFPAGIVSELLNTTPPSSFVNVNAASFVSGPVAANSIVSAFGRALSPGIAAASTLPLPLTLDNVSVSVRDAAGVSRPAPLFYVSPKQLNYAIPDATSAGMATVTINEPGVTVSETQQIAAVGPGLFVAGGFAAGNIETISSGVPPSIANTIFTNPAGALQATPILLGQPGKQVFLILYGTGIRNHVSPAVTVTIGATALTASYAGPTGTYAGEDQINVQLPDSLKGAGVVSVSLTVDGQKTNSGTIFLGLPTP